MKIIHLATAALVLCAGWTATAIAQQKKSEAADAPPPYAATARLKNAEGTEVGTVVFRETPSGFIWINASLYGLPRGVHAFHIHETGDCGDNFKAAGGHYAPGGKDHGVLSKSGPHAGDLPNIHVLEGGRLDVEFFSNRISLADGAENTLFDEDGSAVVIHSGVDDYQSQPAGNAGDRIACGVVSNRIEQSYADTERPQN